MPIYDYQCEKCEHAFEMNLGMDNRNRPTTEPCPECGELSVVKTIGGMPNLGKLQELDMWRMSCGTREPSDWRGRSCGHGLAALGEASDRRRGCSTFHQWW